MEQEAAIAEERPGTLPAATAVFEGVKGPPSFLNPEVCKPLLTERLFLLELEHLVTLFEILPKSIVSQLLRPFFLLSARPIARSRPPFISRWARVRQQKETGNP